MAKRIFLYFLLFTAVVLQSCNSDDDEIKTYQVSVQLSYPDGYATRDSVEIVVTNSLSSSSYKAKTNSEGLATFKLPAGVYSNSVTEVRSLGGMAYNFNGAGNFTIADDWVSTKVVSLALAVSKSSQIIIKELYIGGCQKDDGSGAFIMDKYVILYNNSEEDASLDNLCLGMVLPYNGHATNYDYVNGVLFYESEGWVPAGQGIWYFPSGITLEPGQQIVIALNNAVDNTVTYKKSVNFANATYYCTYDLTAYANTTYYPAPSSLIPTSHYLPGIHYGTGNAWSLSTLSPAFFIFATNGVTPSEFAADAARTSLYNGSSTQVRKKVPVGWVVARFYKLQEVDPYRGCRINLSHQSTRLHPLPERG
jgi:hypothetical protein